MSQSNLPGGWFEYFTDDGEVIFELITSIEQFNQLALVQPYYYNESKNETTWDRPISKTPNHASEIQVSCYLM